MSKSFSNLGALGLGEPFVALSDRARGDIGDTEGGSGMVFSQIDESLWASGPLLHCADRLWGGVKPIV